MTEKKITKKDRFNQLLAIEAVKTNAELVDFIKHEIELLEKKNTSRKPTATQVENVAIGNKIVDLLNKPMTISEIRKELVNAGVGDFNPQKISPIMRNLVADNRVERIEGKRNVVFKRV